MRSDHLVPELAREGILAQYAEDELKRLTIHKALTQTVSGEPMGTIVGRRSP